MQQFAVKIPINFDNFPIINFPVTLLLVDRGDMLRVLEEVDGVRRSFGREKVRAAGRKDLKGAGDGVKVESDPWCREIDDLGHSLDLVAVHIGSCVEDTAVEESEWGREGLADGSRISAEGFDLVSSRVVDMSCVTQSRMAL